MRAQGDQCEKDNGQKCTTPSTLCMNGCCRINKTLKNMHQAGGPQGASLILGQVSAAKGSNA